MDLRTNQSYRRTPDSLTLTEEDVILVQRTHWFSLFAPFLAVIILTSFAIASIIGLYIMQLLTPILTIEALLFILLLTGSGILKICIDWYFHLYVLTTKRIMEVQFTPLFTQDINDILLEQVRCTEVDVRMHGILNQLLDKGDVVLTFDRPTHQEEFSILEISHPQSICRFLVDKLSVGGFMSESPIWFRSQNAKKRLRFSSEIIPKTSFGGI
ncbi:MAG: hypothetical protein HYT10_02035 [Candidatus Levybacteria bacterium]|nr:hypothetical protein [Candidatus Levybacteria bacterium]